MKFQHRFNHSSNTPWFSMSPRSCFRSGIHTFTHNLFPSFLIQPNSKVSRRSRMNDPSFCTSNSKLKLQWGPLRLCSLALVLRVQTNSNSHLQQDLEISCPRIIIPRVLWELSLLIVTREIVRSPSGFDT